MNLYQSVMIANAYEKFVWVWGRRIRRKTMRSSDDEVFRDYSTSTERSFLISIEYSNLKRFLKIIRE